MRGQVISIMKIISVLDETRGKPASQKVCAEGYSQGYYNYSPFFSSAQTTRRLITTSVVELSLSVFKSDLSYNYLLHSKNSGHNWCRNNQKAINAEGSSGIELDAKTTKFHYDQFTFQEMII